MPQAVACVRDSRCLITSIHGCIDSKHPCRKCNLNGINPTLSQCPADHNQLTDCDGQLPPGTCTIPNKQGCDAGIQSLTKPPKTIRNFEIINQCPHDIWVGINGKQRNPPPGKDFNPGFIPNDGGFKLNSGQAKTIHIKNDLHAGVIWGRTNCRYQKYDSGEDVFECDTGQCWNELNERGKNGKCCNDNTCFGPKAPASLAEFTLSQNWCQDDFYDVSLVDGYNLPIKMEPIDPDITVSSTANKYSCGIAKVNTFDAKTNCPQEMKLFGTGNQKNITYCLSICKAVSDLDHANKFSNLKHWGLSTTMASEIDPFDIELQDKPMIDLLCCQCSSKQDNGCYDMNKECNFGCSAFTDGVNPPKWKDEGGSFDEYKQRICPNNGKQTENGPHDINMPKWPMINGVNPAYIYKDTSPGAYSWQFNDQSSTFQCRNSHYKITFCHDHNQPHHDISNHANAGFIMTLILIPIITIVFIIMLFSKSKERTIDDQVSDTS